MSFTCLVCQSEVILDPINASKFEPKFNTDEPVIKEFFKVKNTLVQNLKESGVKYDKLDLDKYDPEQHVICEHCLNEIVTSIEKDTLVDEAKNTDLQHATDALNQDITKTEKRLKEMKIDPEKEKKLLEELKALEAIEEEQKKELETLGKVQIETEKEENNYWEETLAFSKKLFLLNEKKNTAIRQSKELQSELERLSKINVLNDIISISTDHEVAKINDLQLGKSLSVNQVPWLETNAAFGQIVLLFCILENKCLGFRFDRIKMKPQGSFSEVIRVINQQDERYELYGPPKEELRFNHGLFTLLEAMGQIHLFLAGKLSNLIQGGIYDLPHQISGDSLGGIPFKYYSTKLDKWTEVLKYFSLNCKHLIYLYSLYEKNNQIAIKSHYEL